MGLKSVKLEGPYPNVCSFCMTQGGPLAVAEDDDDNMIGPWICLDCAQKAVRAYKPTKIKKSARVIKLVKKKGK